MNLWYAQRWLQSGAAVVSLVALVTLAACHDAHAPTGNTLAVEISHRFAGAPLQLGDSTYTIASGDRVQIRKLRYYLSNFRLHGTNGQWAHASADAKTSQGYFLIDVADPASLHFTIDGIPDGDYDGIEFLLGVDGERNRAGAQTGTLDPARGLFWTWKSGYIFFLLEGQSPQSPGAGQLLKYHLGGDGAARTLYLPLAPKAAHVDAHIEPEIHLHADVAELFRGAHEIHVAELHSTMGGAESQPLIDNLPGIFRVDHVHNEPRGASHEP